MADIHSTNADQTKKTRNKLGTIQQKEVVVSGQTLIVFDVRKRFSVEGKQKELFKRCYCLDQAEKVREDFARQTAQYKYKKHGHTSKFGVSITYKSYESAKERCNNPKAVGYKWYGGRGIEFRFNSFQEFLDEVGERPSKELSIDRIDPNGHYEKGNIRWATKSVQSQNQRKRIKD